MGSSVDPSMVPPLAPYARKDPRVPEPLRLLAVHAHPDDESSKGAAAMARYVAEGVEVLVATCTGGERGSILNPRLQGDPAVEADLPAIRAAEMSAAREIWRRSGAAIVVMAIP